jgi:hypothetical protein
MTCYAASYECRRQKLEKAADHEETDNENSNRTIDFGQFRFGICRRANTSRWWRRHDQDCKEEQETAQQEESCRHDRHTGEQIIPNAVLPSKRPEGISALGPNCFWSCWRRILR